MMPLKSQDSMLAARIAAESVALRVMVSLLESKGILGRGEYATGLGRHIRTQEGSIGPIEEHLLREIQAAVAP
jgi:hypothetical protein